jgi:hypothetical protein
VNQPPVIEQPTATWQPTPGVRKSSVRIVVATVFVGGLIAGSMLASAHAHAATTPPMLKHWIMKAQPDQGYLQSAAAADGVTVPSFGWTLCGQTAAADFDGGPDHWGPCHPGQVPTYASYAALKRGVENGVPQKFGWALMDEEGWVYTPKSEKADTVKYIKLADQLAIAHRFKLIQTPTGPYGLPKSAAAVRKVIYTMIAEDVVAARYGANAVDIQSQFLQNNPLEFETFIKKDMAAIKATGKHPYIIAGLATNGPNGPNSVPNMVLDYSNGNAAGLSGWWLNAANWGPRSKCLPPVWSDPGCGQLAVQFLQAIGETS